MSGISGIINVYKLVEKKVRRREGVVFRIKEALAYVYFDM